MVQEEHTVGILIVHGIGNQTAGETLVAFGDRLFGWLRGWIEGTPGSQRPAGTAELGFTQLSPADSAAPPGAAGTAAPMPPPSSSIQLAAVGQGGTMVRESWMIAEAHWADAFPLPGVSEVTFWLMEVTPLVTAEWIWRTLFGLARNLKSPGRLSTGGKILRRAAPWMLRAGTAARLVAWTAVALAALPAVALAEVSFFLLLVLGWVPISGAEALVRSVQTLIGAVIGDSYAFAASPLRESAITDRFQQRLEAMARRCREIVVVGHSGISCRRSPSAPRSCSRPASCRGGWASCRNSAPGLRPCWCSAFWFSF
jgi:hypothetical protein